jgi:hypothetical protein
MAAPFNFNEEVYQKIYSGWNRLEAENDWREHGNEKWANYQGGGGEPQVSSFEAELKKAYEELKPYYQKMLDLAKGDVDLAKRMIEADYESGVRESKEEFEIGARERALREREVEQKYGYGVKEAEEEHQLSERLRELEKKKVESEYGLNKKELEEEAAIKEKLTDLSERRTMAEYEMGMGEARGAYEQAKREQALTFPAEQRELITSAGKRGIVGGTTEAEIKAGTGGGLVGQEASRLKESQLIREEAVERALQEKEMRLGKEKGFGMEAIGIEKESDTQRLNRALEKLSLGYEVNLEELGIKSAGDAQRLARALEELKGSREISLEGVGIAQQQAEEKLARTLNTLSQQKEFGLEKTERGLTREEQELSRTHEREAGTMAGEAYGRGLTLQQMQEQKAIQARSEQLAKEQWEWQKEQAKKQGEVLGY